MPAGYIGIGSKAKKIKNLYLGVGGVAKKVKKAYIGVGGVAKLWYRSQSEVIYQGHRSYGLSYPEEGSYGYLPARVQTARVSNQYLIISTANGALSKNRMTQKNVINASLTKSLVNNYQSDYKYGGYTSGASLPSYAVFQSGSYGDCYTTTLTPTNLGTSVWQVTPIVSCGSVIIGKQNDKIALMNNSLSQTITNTDWPSTNMHGGFYFNNYAIFQDTTTNTKNYKINSSGTLTNWTPGANSYMEAGTVGTNDNYILVWYTGSTIRPAYVYDTSFTKCSEITLSDQRGYKRCQGLKDVILVGGSSVFSKNVDVINDDLTVESHTWLPEYYDYDYPRSGESDRNYLNNYIFFFTPRYEPDNDDSFDYDTASYDIFKII